MKIGILTVYSFNYGSFFQATALYDQLKKLGHEVEFINERFKKNKWGNLFALYTFDDLLPQFGKRIISKMLPQYRTFLQLKNDVAEFEQSDKKILNLQKLTKNYDLVILGADEMWSASPKSIRYTKEHFGYNIRCRHISYATCGSLFDLNNKKLVSNAGKGFDSFKTILVRDSYTKEVVESISRRKAKVVLDPTLLNPYFIHEYNKCNEDYVLLYGQHYDDKQKEFIINKAKELNCKIMSLGWPIDFADDFLDPDSADEFQGCFARAKYCFPSTFHGTIFSILNHRPFLSMSNELRGKKIRMLLEELNLTDRIYNPEIKDYKDPDYAIIDDILAKKRDKSLELLKMAISG